MRAILLHYVEPHRFHPRPFDRHSSSFGSSYYARPWALVSDLWHEADSIVHRGLYGWDGSDTWSLDAHIVRILPEMLRYLADHTHGSPMWMHGAGDGTEAETTPTNPIDQTIHTDHLDIGKASRGQDAFERWKSWLRDHAQAFDDWSRLMEAGWTAPLSPAAYWETTFEAQVRELGLEAAFNAPGPLDALSDEEKQAALDAWEEKVAQARWSMHELIDHFEDLWD